MDKNESQKFIDKGVYERGKIIHESIAESMDKDLPMRRGEKKMTENDKITDSIVEEIVSETSKQVLDTEPVEPTKKTPPPLQLSSNSIVINDINDLQRIANSFVLSGMYPESLRGNNDKETAAKLLTALITGYEAGLSLTNSINKIAIIKGTPTIWGSARMALVLKTTDIAEIKETVSDTEYRVEALRPSMNLRFSGSFTLKEAKQAGLWSETQEVSKSGNKYTTIWQKYPQRMLKHKAWNYMLDDGWADVIGGMVAREEVLEANPHIVPEEKILNADTSGFDSTQFLGETK